VLELVPEPLLALLAPPALPVVALALAAPPALVVPVLVAALPPVPVAELPVGCPGSIPKIALQALTTAPAAITTRRARSKEEERSRRMGLPAV
jgi:hypothetical protein